MNLRKLYLLLAFMFLYEMHAIIAADTLVILSDNLPKPDTVLVFKPANQQQGLCPAVFLLHGLEGDYGTWNKYIDLQYLSDSLYMIFVCPDGLSDSYFLNSPQIESMQYVNFFYDDLLIQLKNKFPIDFGTLFITGNSMGGHGALNLYLHRPSAFLSCGTISGVLDLSLSGSREGALKKWLGGNNIKQETFMEHSVFYQIEKVQEPLGEIIVHCGKNDFFYDINIAFVEKCKFKNIDVKGFFDDGGHNKDYWAQAIRQQLLHFKKIYEIETGKI